MPTNVPNLKQIGGGHCKTPVDLTRNDQYHAFHDRINKPVRGLHGQAVRLDTDLFVKDCVVKL